MQLVPLGNHGAHQLHNNARRDVGNNRERKDRKVLQRATGEEIELTDHRACRCLVNVTLHRQRVYAGDRNLNPEPKDQQAK